MSYSGGSLRDMTKAVKRASTRAGRIIANDTGKQFRSNIRKNTPIETGRLRNSYKLTRVVYRDDAWVGSVYTNVPYAAPMEYGSGLWGPKRKKFKIEPKKPGGWLAFQPYVRTNANGKPEIVLDETGGPVKKGGKVYTKLVLHPGSPGHGMFRIGAALTEHEMRSIAAPGLRVWKRLAESGMKK